MTSYSGEKELTKGLEMYNDLGVAVPTIASSKPNGGGLMERLKKYVGRPIDLAKIKNTAQLGTFGFECRYLPDPPEDFDEFEFVTQTGTIEQLGLMVTVQSMQIAKLFFGAIDRQNPDLVSGLTEEQLSAVFEEAEANILGLLDYITQEPPTA